MQVETAPITVEELPQQQVKTTESVVLQKVQSELSLGAGIGENLSEYGGRYSALIFQRLECLKSCDRKDQD